LAARCAQRHGDAAGCAAGADHAAGFLSARKQQHPWLRGSAPSAFRSNSHCLGKRARSRRMRFPTL
jgi:hypothetical protein